MWVCCHHLIQHDAFTDTHAKIKPVKAADWWIRQTQVQNKLDPTEKEDTHVHKYAQIYGFLESAVAALTSH